MSDIHARSFEVWAEANPCKACGADGWSQVNLRSGGSVFFCDEHSVVVDRDNKLHSDHVAVGTVLEIISPSHHWGWWQPPTFSGESDDSDDYEGNEYSDEYYSITF